MAKILADDLANNEVSSLAEFMTSASNGKLAQQGKRIEITDLTNKKVKFLLRKFLHTNHLSEYNVLARADTFEIVRIRPEAKSKEDERLAPNPLRANTTSTHRSQAQTGHRVARKTPHEEDAQQEMTSEHAWSSSQHPKRDAV